MGEDRETTIIDGNQSGSVVTFENGEDTTTVLSGFMIKNGLAINPNAGGGIHISNSSSPELIHLILSENISNILTCLFRIQSIIRHPKPSSARTNRP